MVGNFKLQSWNGFWWHDVQNKVEECLSVGPKVARGRKTINMAILSRMLSFQVMMLCSFVYFIKVWNSVLPSREGGLNPQLWGTQKKKFRRDDNIKMALSYMEYESVDLFHLASSQPHSCKHDNEALVSLNGEEFLE